MPTERLDAIRGSVLTQMERANRNVRLAVLGAATAEMVFILLAFTLVDMHARMERLLFIMSLLSYTIIILGLAALGAHVSRCTARVLAAIRPDARA